MMLLFLLVLIGGFAIGVVVAVLELLRRLVWLVLRLIASGAVGLTAAITLASLALPDAT
jgi:hypothetical protein